MKIARMLVVLALLGALAGATAPAAPSRAAKGGTLTVMTRNLYLGASLERVLAARTLNDVFAIAAGVWATAPTGSGRPTTRVSSRCCGYRS